MAFLIPDNLKSRSDVPPEVRNVARALELGLDDDAVVWFEPASGQGENVDLIVLLPDHGVAVLQVVGNDTLKAHGVPITGATAQTKQRLPIAERFRCAEEFADGLRRRMANEPQLSGAAVPVAAGAVFTSLTEAELLGKAEIHVPAQRCLFRSHLDAALEGSGEAGLLRAFRQMLDSAGTGPASKEGRRALRELVQPAERREQLLRGLIHPQVVIDRIASSGASRQLSMFRPVQEGEDVLRVMDRKQEALAMSLGTGHRVIRGVAGSGKTLILVYRVRLLARLFPRQSFLLTCSTRSVAAELRSLLKEHRNVEVTNVHKLMVRAIQDAGMVAGDVRDEQVLAEAALNALGGVPRMRYRAVLVDEAQDLSTETLRFLLALLEEPTGDFVVVADAAQNIFRKRFNWKKAGIQAAGRTQVLRHNYRNTREIVEFAFRFLMSHPNFKEESAPDLEDEHALIPPETALRRGPLPKVRIEPDVGSEVTAVVEQAQLWAKLADRPRQVAVLYANGEEEGRAPRLHQGLVEAGLPVFWVHKKTVDAIGEAKESVLMASVHSAKGLDFPSVVLCGLWRPEVDAMANRSLAYVGMTRAMDRLAVVTHKGNPLAAELQAALRAEGAGPP